METITVYKDSYKSLLDREFELLMEVATLKGTITALAGMEDSPEFVFRELKALVENFKK